MNGEVVDRKEQIHVRVKEAEVARILGYEGCDILTVSNGVGAGGTELEFILERSLMREKLKGVQR